MNTDRLQQWWADHAYASDDVVVKGSGEMVSVDLTDLYEILVEMGAMPQEADDE